MLSLRGAGYRYPSAAAPAARDVSLDVAPGEIVLLTGPTGCGKSTVLRLAAGLLARHGSGEVLGEVRLGAGDGLDPATLPPAARAAQVGFVAQNPNRQLITGTLGDEVAFAMESVGRSPDAIASAVPDLLARVGLPATPERSTEALSGGERQRLMVAAGLSAGAGLLLLDEPLAHLDPAGARHLLGVLRRLADEQDLAVLLVEHRLGPTLPVADRLAVMADGVLRSVVPAATPDRELLAHLGLRLPPDPAQTSTLEPSSDVRAAKPAQTPTLATRGALLTATDLTWSWPKAAAPALREVSATVHRGERIALLGGNGAGKSTLLACLVGAARARGVTRADGVRSVRVPQDPDLSLFCETVRAELAYGPRENRRPAALADRLALDAAAALSVGDLLDRPPQALSRGQRLRVAVAAALACEPDVLVLDEPTSGQDHDQVERMMEALRDDRRALLFATHDVALALRHATRVWVLDGGRLVADLDPAAAAAPGALPEALR